MVWDGVLEVELCPNLGARLICWLLLLLLMLQKGVDVARERAAELDDWTGN